MEAIVMVSSQYSSALHTIALSAASSPLALSSALCKSSPYVSNTYLIALFTDAFSIGDYYMLKVSYFGFLYAFLGFGYLGYKKQFSSIATIMGALLLVAGAFMFAGIGVFLALIPWTLAEIVQIGLMIYLIQKIGRVNSPDFSS